MREGAGVGGLNGLNGGVGLLACSPMMSSLGQLLVAQILGSDSQRVLSLSLLSCDPVLKAGASLSLDAPGRAEHSEKATDEWKRAVGSRLSQWPC